MRFPKILSNHLLSFISHSAPRSRKNIGQFCPLIFFDFRAQVGYEFFMPINGLTINQEKELRRRRQADAPQVSNAGYKIHAELKNLYELVSQYRRMQKAGSTISAAMKHDQIKAIDDCLRELRPIMK